MDSTKLALGLSELRRELEEILVLVSRSVAANPLPAPQSFERELSEIAGSARVDHSHSRNHKNLFDDALIVITEFGQATPAILQMWLSIDYSGATAMLKQLEAHGFVSPKGKVRHKAYEERRARGLEFKF